MKSRTEINKENCIELANKIKSLGYDVYIAEKGTYGFFTNGERLVSFQIDYQMNNTENNNAIVYRLHKDGSPVVIPNLSNEKAVIELEKLKTEGYKNAYITTNENADKVLNDFGELFKPKPLTAKERWNKWAIGK